MHCNNQKKLFAFKHPRIILVLICAQFWRSLPNFDPLVGFNLNVLIKSKAVVQRCSVKKVLLEISQNSRENTCARVSPVPEPQACNVIKKETLAQVFSCEFCEISKNIFFIEHLWWLLLNLHLTEYLKIFIMNLSSDTQMDNATRNIHHKHKAKYFTTRNFYQM